MTSARPTKPATTAPISTAVGPAGRTLWGSADVAHLPARGNPGGHRSLAVDPAAENAEEELRISRFSYERRVDPPHRFLTLDDRPCAADQRAIFRQPEQRGRMVDPRFLNKKRQRQ